jgi:hypothetical protein
VIYPSQLLLVTNIILATFLFNPSNKDNQKSTILLNVSKSIGLALTLSEA